MSWQAAATVPSETEREAILEVHTYVRQHVDPPSKNMRLMKYSGTMEGLAEKWVDRCVSRKPDPSIYKDYAGTAQVLIVSHKSQTTFTKTISAVKEEAQHYEYRDNTCTGECDFYKQIIWANLTEVGCAMKTCVTYVQRKVTPANVVVCVYKIA
uniref:SCP domain-containing protein n=1 Tax=Mesocestoides corti TaxID=53468 RepID=A0A5K3FIB9_MESCO